MMPALRQFGVAIAISVISLGLVIGGLSLALSENFTPPPAPTAAASQVPPSPSLFLTVTASATPQILPSGTFAPTATNTPVSPTACTPPAGWIGVVVGSADTLESLALKYRTSAQLLAQANCLLTGTLSVGSTLYVPPLPATSIPTSTRVPCGAPFGWVRYTVQQGDTLYHIATMYGITTTQLQQANCLGSSTTIHPGQLLWVPNRPPLVTVTPGVTVIPTFVLPTETFTEIPPTFTETLEPTSINTPVTPES